MGNCVRRRGNKISSIVTDSRNSTQKMQLIDEERKKLLMLTSKQPPVLSLDSELYKRRVSSLHEVVTCK
jgi:hypothetical protein